MGYLPSRCATQRASCLNRMAGVIVLGCTVLAGCWSATDREVIVYVALDAEFSRPVLERFQQETGIRVLAKYDVESTKTVGLTNAIIAEAGRPRCDVFWNNEILNTVRLANRGLLQAYDSPQRPRFPRLFCATNAMWTGFAARARVLLVNTQRLPDPATWPKSISDLSEPKWQGQVALAKPLFGTTATHAMVLYDRWGQETAEAFFAAVQANAQIMSGNKQVALAVARGQIAWGLTDTDDAIIEVERGMPVAIIYPDQGDDQLGTLFLPNTVAIIQGAPHGEAAQRLIDYLLSADVERMLAASPSAQIPLASDIDIQPRVQSPREIRAMSADFERIAPTWDAVAASLQSIFMRAD